MSHPTSRALALHDRIVATVLQRLQAPLLLLVRLAWGWSFFLTGKGKLLHLERTTDFFAGLGIPLPMLNALGVGTLECLGGLLLMVGLMSRPIAALLSGSMVVALLTADRAALTGLFTDLNGFLTAAPVPFLLACLLVLAFGPGRLSVDALLRRRLAGCGHDHGMAARRPATQGMPS